MEPIDPHGLYNVAVVCVEWLGHNITPRVEL